MKVRVLGCSGGLGGAANRTTSFLVDHDILIDAGTGVGDLTLEELHEIRYVFLTHAHLDHIAALPIMVDTVADQRGFPLTVLALPHTIEALKTHIFNWVIWPDFASIPSPEAPLVRYQPVSVGEVIELEGRRICPLPAQHTVPAVGYHLDSGRGSWVFSGDTSGSAEFMAAVNAIDNLRYLVMETAFPDEKAALAQASRHYSPQALAQDLNQLKPGPKVFITHLKPGHAVRTMCQLETQARAHAPTLLETGQMFEF